MKLRITVVAVMVFVLTLTATGVIWAEGEGGTQSDVYQDYLYSHVKIQQPEAQDDYVTVFVDMPSEEEAQQGITLEKIYNDLNVTVKVNDGADKDTTCLIDDTDKGERFAFTTKDKFGRLNENDQVTVQCSFTDQESQAWTRNIAAGKASSTPQYKRRTVSLTVTPKIAAYVYNGSYNKAPATVVAKYNGETLPAAAVSFEYLKHEKSRNVGTAYVTVEMTGDYIGTGTGLYTIIPKNAKFKSVKKIKKGFKANWTPQKTKMATFYITGYQIRYSLNKNMSKAKIVTVGKRENKDYKLKTKTIKKLKSKKKYYVQIRTYKKLNGKKYYSKWSAIKTVKTK